MNILSIFKRQKKINSLMQFKDENNLTNKDLANLFDISEAYISYYLNGKRTFGAKLAVKVSSITNIPVQNLYPNYWSAKNHNIKKNQFDVRSNSNWHSFDYPKCLDKKENKKQLSVPGVYILIKNKSKILYVGQSQNVYKRLVSHIRTFQGFKKLIVKVRIDGYKFERLTLEAKLIKRLKPTKNKK